MGHKHLLKTIILLGLFCLPDTLWAQVPLVSPIFPDVVVAPVTTRVFGVPNSHYDDVVVNCDMLETHTGKPLFAITWDEGCRSDNVYAYFQDVSTGLSTTINFQGSRPDIVIADNPASPGNFRAILTHYDKNNYAWITMYNLNGIGTGSFTATYFTDFQIGLNAYPAPFFNTSPMPHIDMWSDPWCNANINGWPPLPCMHEFLVTWTERDPITGASDIYGMMGHANGTTLSAAQNLSTLIPGHAGQSNWSDVACYSDAANINAIEKHAVFTYRYGNTGLTVVDVNVTTLAPPVVYNQTVNFCMFTRIEAMNLIRAGFDPSIWQVVAIAQVPGVNGWQPFGIHNLAPFTMTHLSPDPTLSAMDIKSPCVAGGMSQSGGSGIGNQQFTVGFFPRNSGNLFVRDINLSSGTFATPNYYQVNTNPLASGTPIYDFADASKSFALSTCSNVSPYLLSAWYDGHDIGGGAGGQIVMKLTPSPTVMQFRTTNVNTLATDADTKLYPNPTNDVLYVTASGNYIIRSISGSVLSRGKVEQGKAIDVSHLSAGVYWMEFGGCQPLTFVKQ